MSSLLGYSNGERKPTAADRLADAVEALIEGNPHLFYLEPDKQYRHDVQICTGLMKRLAYALAEARSEEAK